MKLPVDTDSNRLSDFRGLIERQKQVTYDPNNPNSMYASTSGKFEENPGVFSKFRMFGGSSNNTTGKSSSSLNTNKNADLDRSPQFGSNSEMLNDEKMNELSLTADGVDNSIDNQNGSQSSKSRLLAKKKEVAFVLFYFCLFVFLFLSIVVSLNFCFILIFDIT